MVLDSLEIGLEDAETGPPPKVAGEAVAETVAAGSVGRVRPLRLPTRLHVRNALSYSNLERKAAQREKGCSLLRMGGIAL